MTLNGVMALMLRPDSSLRYRRYINHLLTYLLTYFTEFVYDVVVKQLPRFRNLLLIVYDHINTICAIIQQLFGQNHL